MSRHHPSSTYGVNATSLLQFTTLCSVFLLGRLCKRLGSVLFLTNNTCVKYGKFVDLSEAASIEFIRAHTSIPVPKVYCAFRRSGETYILMQRIRGRKLASGWNERSEESKAIILTQLKVMIDEMRSIKPPYGAAVSNITGGSLYDMRLPDHKLDCPRGGPTRFGPFEDIRSFHRWLRRPAYEIDERNEQEVNELIATHESTAWESPVFTHGDLSSLNILVRGDQVVGIIDWETAGWYPSYWEYVTASQVNFRHEMWAEYIDKFLEPRQEELKMEHIRMKYFGDT